MPTSQPKAAAKRRPWTDADNGRLIDSHRARLNMAEIHRYTGRSMDSLHLYAGRLGLDFGRGHTHRTPAEKAAAEAAVAAIWRGQERPAHYLPPRPAATKAAAATAEPAAVSPEEAARRRRAAEAAALRIENRDRHDAYLRRFAGANRRPAPWETGPTAQPRTPA